MPRFWKDIVAPGKYHPTGSPPVEITPDRIRHWVRQFHEMKRSGVPAVPVPWDHTDDARPGWGLELSAADSRPLVGVRPNAGYVEDMTVDESGTLKALIHIPLEDDAKRIGTTVRYVSLNAEPEFQDGAGRRWNDVITHVALCNYPINHKQTNFQPAAPLAMGVLRLSLSQRGPVMADEEMDETTAEAPPESPPEETEPVPVAPNPYVQLLSLLAEHGVDIPAETPVAAFLPALKAAVQRLEQSVENPPDQQPEQAPPNTAEESPLVMSLRKQLEESEDRVRSAETRLAEAEARQTEHLRMSLKSRVQSLVDTGRATPAMVRGLGLDNAIGTIRFSAGAGKSEAEIRIETLERNPAGSAWEPNERATRFGVQEQALPGIEHGDDAAVVEQIAKYNWKTRRNGAAR